MANETNVTLSISRGTVKLSMNQDGTATVYFEYPSFGTTATGSGTLSADELAKLRQWVSDNVGEITSQDVGG